VPGPEGVVRRRERNGQRLLRSAPELERNILQHDSSRNFMREHALGLDDRLLDGFRARFSFEVLLIDEGRDPWLRRWLDDVQRNLLRSARQGWSLERRVHVLAGRVADALGGNGDAEAVRLRYEDCIAKSGIRPPEELLLGKLIEANAGMCRHRALLFKYACDQLALARCTLLTGVVAHDGAEELRRGRMIEDDDHDAANAHDHMWNTVEIGDDMYVVDCMRPELVFESSVLLCIDEAEAASSLRYHRIGGREGLISMHHSAPRVAREAAPLPERD